MITICNKCMRLTTNILSDNKWTCSRCNYDKTDDNPQLINRTGKWIDVLTKNVVGGNDDFVINII